MHNLQEYPNLPENISDAEYGFTTNFNDETDRLYDHLINNKNNQLFDYLIEVIKDKNSNLYHNYKMMKDIKYGDKP